MRRSGSRRAAGWMLRRSDEKEWEQACGGMDAEAER